MKILKRLKRLFVPATIEEMEQERDCLALVRALENAPPGDPDDWDSAEAQKIEDALARLQDPEAADPLIKLIVDRCRAKRDLLDRAHAIEEQAMRNLRSRPGIGMYRTVMAVGRSPAETVRQQARGHSQRCSTAVRCLVVTKAAEPVKAALRRRDVATDAEPYAADVREKLQDALSQIEARSRKT